MEQLSDCQEDAIRRFSGLLKNVVTVEDMFPPEEDGVREPRPQPLPKLPPAAVALCLNGN
jgi:hypothetical protein